MTLFQYQQKKIDGRCFIEGSSWVNVKEQSFKDRLKKFRKGSTLPKEWAMTAAPKLEKDYSLKSIFRHYDKNSRGYN